MKQTLGSLYGFLSLLALAGAALLAACGGGGGGGGGGVALPANLSYLVNPASYAACTAIAVNTPSSTGGAVTAYAVAPALPAGLNLSPTTGVIAGTPTAAAAMTTYTVAASNAAGSTQVALVITVATSAPSGLSYGSSSPTYVLGFPIAANAPSVTGAASNYALSVGTLPAGLSLDASTGVISGAPLFTQAATSITITASNCEGLGTDAIVTITIPNPAARAAYVTNQTDNTVSSFVQDPGTGQLRHTGYVFTGGATGPRAVAVNPSGAFVYVACTTSSQVFAYTANAITGRLAAVVGSPYASGGTSPAAIVVDRTGRYLYVANGNGAVGAFSIDSGTGALTTVAGSPFSAGTLPSGMAGDPAGKFLYVCNSGSDDVSAFAITSATGALTGTPGSPFAVGTSPTGVAVTPSGAFLYCANAGTSDTVSAFSIDATSGALIDNVAGNPFAGGADPFSIAIDPTGAFAYTANLDVTPGTVSLYSIDAGTGVLTAGATVVTGTAPVSIDVDPEGAFAYVVNLGDAEVRTYLIGGGGALTPIAPFETRTRNGPTSIVLAPSPSSASFATSALYVANRDSSDVNQYAVSALDGMLGALTPAQVGSSPAANAIEVHPFLDFAFMTSFTSGGASIDVFSLSPTGNLSAAGTADTQQGNWATYVEPSGRFAYMTGGASPGRVTPYSINQSTGGLTPGTNSTAGDFPRGGAVHPNGKYFYTANQFSDSISGFQVDPATGSLSALSPATYATGSGPFALAVDPSGRFVYCVNQGTSDSLSMYSVNPLSGVLSPLVTAAPAVGTDPIDVAVTPSGRFVYVANRGSSTITGYFVNTNPTNLTEDGSLTALAPASIPTAGQPRSLTIDANGTHLYVSVGSDNVAGSVESYAISPIGTLTLDDSDAAGTENRGLAVRSRVQ